MINIENLRNHDEGLLKPAEKKPAEKKSKPKKSTGTKKAEGK